MKTFDLAVEHLKEFNFEKFDPYNYIKCKNEIIYSEGHASIYHTMGSEMDDIYKSLEKVSEIFLKDKRNTQSNNTWKLMVFSVAFFHLAEKSIKENSIFDVACVIVEAHKNSKGTRALYANTVYPEVMMNEFFEYCKKIDPCPYYIEDSEIMTLFPMIAYHYLID